MNNSCFQLFSTSLVMMFGLAALSISPACADATYTWNPVSCGTGRASVVEMPGQPGFGHWRFASSNKFIKITNGATSKDDAGAQLRILREDSSGRFNFGSVEITAKGAAADKVEVRFCFLKDGSKISYQKKLGQFKKKDVQDGFVEYKIEDDAFPGFDGPLARRPILVRLTLTLSGPSSPAQTVLIGRTRLVENTWIYPDQVALKTLTCAEAQTCP